MHFNLKLWIKQLDQEFIKRFSMQMGCHPEEFVFTCLDIKILFCFFFKINQKITLGVVLKPKQGGHNMRDVQKIYDVGPAHSNLGELMIVVPGLEEHTCHMWNFPQVVANILFDSHAGGGHFWF